MMPTALIAKSAATLKAFRITATDTNYFACLLDPIEDGVTFTLVVEIFEPGGKTPPNTHLIAEEAFFVLSGTGTAYADGTARALKPGDCIVLRPGCEHVVENPGPGKLYCLTFMAPNEGFAELIRNGIPVELTDDDRRVLCHLC